MTSRFDFSKVLRQLSPHSSIEVRPEIERTGDHVEVTVPSSWLKESRVDGPDQLVLTDSAGRERRVQLTGSVHGRPAAETYGNLALLRLPCDETQTVPAKDPMASRARVTRHLGHRGAMGAA